jgi:type I restriction enzyme S subunit
MSSKSKATATAEEAKPALVPKLRFPEFGGLTGWKANDLVEVADFVNEKVNVAKVSPEAYVSTECILPDYAGIAGASKLPATGSVTRFKPDDTLVSNIRPYLKKVWVADKEGGASNDVIVIRAKRALLPEYLACLLKNDAFIDYVMTGAKGVKMPRGDIGSMKEYPTLFPSPAEQQKIAECLSSVDELMAAQARKVDALKTHKKGLMQQLFPREGETQPRLRFPEFHGGGEWEARNLQELSESISSGKDKAAIDGSFDLYGSTGIIGKTHNHSYCGSYLLVARVGANAGLLTKATGEFGVTDNTLVIILKAQQSIDFVLYYLDQVGLNKMIFGSGQPLITGGQLKALSLRLPKNAEQQRIASCLSSLDALITAETQKLDALKTHKKGLMQKLFPSPEAVEV